MAEWSMAVVLKNGRIDYDVAVIPRLDLPAFNPQNLAYWLAVN